MDVIKVLLRCSVADKCHSVCREQTNIDHLRTFETFKCPCIVFAKEFKT